MAVNKKHFLSFITGLTVLYLCNSCKEQAEKRMSPLGITEEADMAVTYDLPQIQETGELIAVTLSGPDTYYEYRGKGFGVQFELAESFASIIGTKLRMETVRDTAELFRRLQSGDADLIALEMTEGKDTRQAGVCHTEKDSTSNKRLAWAVRKDAPLLAEALDAWYTPDKRTTLIERERKRLTTYAHTTRRRLHAPIQNRAKGIISPYDSHFIRHSSAIGWDWRLMAAQCYQESGFDPDAVSWAGARGLMQIMPGTAAHLGLPLSMITQPEQNIAAAARYIRELDRKFGDVPGRAERINFILAAYNGGAGHVRDAMSLARKNGKNPHCWNDVSAYILNLSQPKFYNDPVVKYGFLRGQETFNYVKSIQERWQYYKGNVAGEAVTAAPVPSRHNARKGFKSRVLSAEELEARAKEAQE